VVTGTVISSTAFNALTADLATGLSTAVTKDGQTTTTARVPFAQGISSTLVTDATSATTGSIITAGGISTQKALWVGTTSRHVGATQFDAAITYGGVTLSNAVTGTGSMVLSTSPTLTTPVLGAATATSINFGGSTLSTYAVGSWTPTDASGAALSFGGLTTANYTRIGNMVYAYAYVGYPVTADVSAALIGGLPFTTANARYSRQGFVSASQVATLRYMAPTQNATTVQPLTSAFATLTNATLSNSDIYFECIYPIA